MATNNMDKGERNVRNRTFLSIIASITVAVVILAAVPVVDADPEGVVRIEICGDATEYGIDGLEASNEAVNNATGDVTITILNDFSVDATGKEDWQAVLEVTNQNDIKIIVDGQGHTISATGMKTVGKYCNVLNIQGCKDILVKDLKVDGGDVSDDGIYIGHSANAILENVTSVNNGDSGLVVDGAIAVVSDASMAGNPVGAIDVVNGGTLVLTGDNDLGTGRQIFSSEGSATVDAEGYVGFGAGTDGEMIWFENGEVPEEFPEGYFGYYVVITLPDDGQLKIPEGMAIPEIVRYGDNEASFKDMRAGVGGAVFKAGSVEISGNLEAVSDNSMIRQDCGEVILRDLTISSGTVEVMEDVIVEGILTIVEGASASVSEYANLNVANDAWVLVAGSLSTSRSGKVIGGGTVECLAGGDISDADTAELYHVMMDDGGSETFNRSARQSSDVSYTLPSSSTDGSDSSSFQFEIIVGIIATVITVFVVSPSRQR